MFNILSSIKRKVLVGMRFAQFQSSLLVVYTHAHHWRILLLWFSPNSHREDSYIILMSACFKSREFNVVTVLHCCHQDICYSYPSVRSATFELVLFSSVHHLYCTVGEIQCAAKSEKLQQLQFLTPTLHPQFTWKKKTKQKARKKAVACEEFSCNREQFVQLLCVVYSCKKLLQGNRCDSLLLIIHNQQLPTVCVTKSISCHWNWNNYMIKHL